MTVRRPVQLAEALRDPSQVSGLFDSGGLALGSTVPSAANQRGDAKTKTISDWLPEIDSFRWAALWRGIEAGREETFWAISRVGGGEDGEAHVTMRGVLQDGERYASLEVRPSTETTMKLRLSAFQQDVLEAVASGVPLAECMAILCRRAEELAPSAICSVLAVDSDGRLRPLASPSLPAHYSAAIDGAAIGPASGSCGTAAYLGKPVTVTDIANDTLWAEFREQALSLGLRACWSSPIKSRSGRVIGTFAFYYHTTRGPTEFEQRIVAACVHVCSIAIEHHDAHSRIEEMALHDTLTQLANRAGFQARLVEALRRRPDAGHAIAVHCIDLEDFKAINDTLGQPVGDKLLQAIAIRLRSMTRRTEVIARMGSDEFAVLQPGIEGDADAAALAERIIEVVAQPYSIDGRNVVIGASVGIAVGRYDAVTPDMLMANADLALSNAKVENRGSYRLFSPEIDARVRAQRTLECDLHTALADGQFELNFQPLFSAENRKLRGFETLMRWRHPRRGLIPPGEFIPLAERTGLIAPLGEWALRQACETAARWPEPLRVAVNLSPAQFASQGLVQIVTDALLRSGLAPRRLELEITENVFLQNSEMTRDTLYKLRALGVRIALDDFGTGYSSLSYLLSFPFDKIKIDRSFIIDIATSTRSQKIVKAVAALAGDLDMETTAEGIETEEQLEAVRKAGCKELQGFLLGYPKPVGDLDGLLQGAAKEAQATDIKPARAPRKRQANPPKRRARSHAESPGH